MIISFLIIAISLAIIYLSSFKSKRDIVLTSIFVPLSYFFITILLLSSSYGSYYAGQRIAGSIIPIVLSGFLLYNNLICKLNNKSKTPFILICLAVLFFVFFIVEIYVKNALASL